MAIQKSELEGIYPDIDQGRGNRVGWVKSWMNIVQQMRGQGNIRTLNSALVHIDPYENRSPSLALALSNLIGAEGQVQVFSAICPPYENPELSNEKQLRAGTGKKLTDYDPALVDQAFTNAGHFLRSLSQEPVNLNLFAVNGLTESPWQNLAINPTVIATMGPDEADRTLAQNFWQVAEIAGNKLSEKGIQLTMHPLEQTLKKAEQTMNNQVPAELLNQVRQNPQQGRAFWQRVTETIPHQAKHILSSDEPGGPKDFRTEWGVWGDDAALFNFYFYLQLGHDMAQKTEAQPNQRAILQLDIEPLSTHPTQLLALAAGYHGVHEGQKVMSGFGADQIPLATPRPVIEIDYNIQIQSDQGIRQRWIK